MFCLEKSLEIHVHVGGASCRDRFFVSTVCVWCVGPGFPSFLLSCYNYLSYVVCYFHVHNYTFCICACVCEKVVVPDKPAIPGQLF